MRPVLWAPDRARGGLRLPGRQWGKALARVRRGVRGAGGGGAPGARWGWRGINAAFVLDGFLGRKESRVGGAAQRSARPADSGRRGAGRRGAGEPGSRTSGLEEGGILCPQAGCVCVCVAGGRLLGQALGARRAAARCVASLLLARAAREGEGGARGGWWGCGQRMVQPGEAFGGAWGDSCGLPRAPGSDRAAGAGMARGEEVGAPFQGERVYERGSGPGPLFRTTELWINGCYSGP